MFLELLEESYYQYAKFAAKGFEYKYMSYTVALLRAMFIYLFVYHYHFLKAQAIINDHLEHRRQERVEDPREYKINPEEKSMKGLIIIMILLYFDVF